MELKSKEIPKDIFLSILDHLDSTSSKSFSGTCRSFRDYESFHRNSLCLLPPQPLHPELIPNTLQRYPYLSEIVCHSGDDETLILISELHKDTLRSIDLSRSRVFTHLGLLKLIGNCSKLVDIDLSKVATLTDVKVAAIAESKNLKRLHLGWCKRITDVGISRVAMGCRSLRFLSLRWCPRITDTGVEILVLNCKEIRSLDLSGVRITEKCLPSILGLEHLGDLILEGCSGLNDRGLATLKQGCKSLKMLDLSYCYKLSHTGLSSLINDAVDIQSIVLIQCNAVITGLENCLCGYTKLQSLILDSCTIAPSLTEAIAKLDVSLKELSFNRCMGINDEGLSLIVHSHKKITKLNVAVCNAITDASIDSITTSCTFLSSLVMKSCVLVTKEAFTLIGERCKNLNELDVSFCQFDDEGLVSASRCSKLTILKMRGCRDLTDEGIKYLGRKCHMLKQIDLERCAGVSVVGLSALVDGCKDLEVVSINKKSKLYRDAEIAFPHRVLPRFL